MRATRAVTHGPTRRTPSRRPTMRASPSTTSASDRPGSIRCRKCSDLAVPNVFGEWRSFRGCWPMSIESSSQRDPRTDRGEMTTETYFANGNEVQLFEQAFRQHVPVMLTGPTGCGKTRFVEHMGLLLRRPVVTISCHDDLTSSDLVGRFMVTGGDEVRTRQIVMAAD